MKIILSIAMYIVICNIDAQDAGMHIIVDEPIINGSDGGLKLQSSSSKGATINTLLLDGTDIQTFDEDSSWYCGNLYIQDQGGSIYFLDGSRGKATFDGNVVFRDSIEIGGAIQTSASSEIAFGAIDSDADIASGSGNYEVVWTGSRYEITLEDESYHFRSYTTLITPNSSSVYSHYSSSGSGKIFVYLRNNAGSNISAPFHFVTHKHQTNKKGFTTYCESDDDEVIIFLKNRDDRE